MTSAEWLRICSWCSRQTDEDGHAHGGTVRASNRVASHGICTECRDVMLAQYERRRARECAGVR